MTKSSAEPPSNTPRLRLVGDDGRADQTFPLAPGRHVIGSGSAADLRLSDPSVSRRHAELIVGEDGSVRVRDLDSKNGTRVDDQPITEAVVAVGDELRCGPVRLRLEPMDPGDAVLGLDWTPMPTESRSVAEQSTLFADPAAAGGSRQLTVVDSFFAHLAEPASADWASALDGVAQALGASGAMLVEWQSEPSLLAAVGEVAELPSASAVRRQLQGTSSGAIVTLEGPADEAPLWTAAVVHRRDEPVGLVVVGEFPGRSACKPLLGTLLRLALHVLAPRLASLDRDGEPQRSALDFPPGIVRGASAAMVELYRRMEPLGRGDLPVLLVGETGVGKEHLAKTLHRSSSRRDGPFVAINCAAIPETLLEAELFGIGKGVASGVEARPGRFKEAHGGTLFLDEVGEMPADLQAKLLRALQEHEVHPLGLAPVAIDVRVVAATNADLARRIDDGEFRADLYYRLAGCVLDVPPLRDRRSDLPRLIAHFVRRFSEESGIAVRGVTVRALEQLTVYRWPGNIRELEFEIRRLVYACPSGRPIDSEMLSEPLRSAVDEVDLDGEDPADETADDLALEERLEALERRLIRTAMKRTAGNQTRAARLLGVSRNGLAYRLDRLGIEVADFIN